MESLLVGTLDGIFNVAKTGSTWKILSQSLQGMEVNALVKRPDKSGTFYGGIRGGGVYRTDDAGVSWRRLGENILSDKIRTLALDPTSPEMIYVGTEPPGLWKSEDGGQSWNEILSVAELAREKHWTYPVQVIQPHVRSIAIDPFNSKRLCLAAQVGGVLVSEDGGDSWTDVRHPIDLDVHCVIFDANKRAVIYAATGGGENFPDPTPPPKGRPLYRSLNGGDSWESISDTLTRSYAVPVRVHPQNSNLIYLGVAEEPPPLWLNRSTKANGALMRSVDGGITWQQLGGGFPNPYESMVECVEFDPEQPDHVFVGTGGEGARFIKLDTGEIFHSTDRGDTWSKIPVSLPIIYALAVQ